MSNNNKVKGLLKGLRFISQIFDSDEKESEIQIGHPTDVKHVAHIGWDGHGQGQGQGQGPSENNPSWMNEFQSVPGNSSAPLNLNGGIQSKGSSNSIQMASEGQKDSHELPKSSKRQSNSMGHIRESHAKEKSDRPRQPRKSSKQSQSNDSYNESMHTDADSDLPPTRRSRSKISKDGSSGSTKSRSKAHHHSRDSNESNYRSGSKTKNKHGSFEEDAQFERGSSENVLKSYPN